MVAIWHFGKDCSVNSKCKYVIEVKAGFMCWIQILVYHSNTYHIKVAEATPLE